MAFVVSIAGSDSSGGSGLQADIACINALGHHPLSVVTAITSQDLDRVQQVVHCDTTTVQAQLDAVFTWPQLGAVKSGMLPRLASSLLAQALIEQPTPLPYVLDPILQASSGTPLVDADSQRALVLLLFPLATVVTPNIPEAEQLTGRTISSMDEMISAGQDLLNLGCRAVLVKGGHSSNDPGVDVLLDAQDGRTPYFIHDSFIANRSPRGTGCTYASAIACGLASGLTLYNAIFDAKRYITRAIATAYEVAPDAWLLNHQIAAQDE